MKNKLNEADEFFLLNNSYSVDEFVKKLNVNKDVVEKFLFNNKERILIEPTMLEWDQTKQLWRNPKTGEYCVGPVVEPTDTKQTVETKQKVASGLKAGDLMARNEKYGAVVMTPGASEMGDLSRQNKKKELDETKSIDQNLLNNVCFEIDDWIRDADQTIWIADLSNGLTAYRDDGRFGHVYSAWSRLKQYCEENNVYVTNMVLKFRSHVEKIPQSDVYFVRNSLLGGFSKKGVRNDHSLLIGTLQGEVLQVQKWKIPELILTSTTERPIDENALRSMIWKKNTNHPLLG